MVEKFPLAMQEVRADTLTTLTLKSPFILTSLCVMDTQLYGLGPMHVLTVSHAVYMLPRTCKASVYIPEPLESCDHC